MKSERRGKFEKRKEKALVFAVLFAMLAFLSVGCASAATYVSGPITSDTTWTLANSPYIVVGSVLVNNGVTLTIEPGVTVKFDSGLALRIDGTLIAQGTSDSMITFTSNQTTPAAGDWGYILFTDSSTDASYDVNENYTGGCILQYCTVEYGGGAEGINGMIRIESSSPFIDHCIIKDSVKSGIDIDSGSPNISFNTIENNSNGIFLINSNSIVNDNTIRNNSVFTSDKKSFPASGSVEINNNTISNNEGLGIGSGTYVTSTGFLDIGSGIFVNGGNVSILNNIITSNLKGSSYPKGGGISCYSYDVMIVNNLIENNSDGGVGGSRPFAITDNIINSNLGSGIRVSSATQDNITITSVMSTFKCGIKPR